MIIVTQTDGSSFDTEARVTIDPSPRELVWFAVNQYRKSRGLHELMNGEFSVLWEKIRDQLSA